MYGVNNVMLQVGTGNSLPGDFDGNGMVDAADLASWRAGFGKVGGASHSQGDADADLDVDGADFLVWQRQLGSFAAGESSSIPEPTTGFMLLLGMAAISFPRRKVRGAMRTVVSVNSEFQSPRGYFLTQAIVSEI
ncbi:MAG: PEP-CTERM sorting domain-containing protein [Pirellulales bacterium]|nr:PEP-CTERM sorting domain-containing protein [Pirellulales bacterium]